ncbi:MAG TPA: hypothetical protein VHX37_00705 [Acidobacteriaceae bacterium]|jgi:uncharacterized membrane protein|nr:hypothetical protein [Acidobacteriaceae bacterium]
MQKKAVVSAAGAVVLGMAPLLAMKDGHRWVGLVFIGVQVVLLVVAIRYLVAMKQARAARE